MGFDMKNKNCVRDAECGEDGTALNEAKRSEGIAEEEAGPITFQLCGPIMITKIA